MEGRSTIMMTRGWLAALLVCSTALPAGAQTVASVGALIPNAEQSRARFQIAAMEGVLASAVQLGARRLSQQVQTISPDLLFIAGAARAKGFQLEGYGVFFDVDVPALRRSMAWSFRQLGRADANIEAAMTTLRRNLMQVSDPAARRETEEAIQRLQKIVGPIGAPPATQPGSGTQTVSATSVPDADAPAPLPTLTPQQASIIDDPGAAYTNEVKAALIDAMLDYGAPIPIAENEWLTVAARDDNNRLGGSDPYDSSTIVLRVRGADLTAFRAGSLNRADAAARVEVREY
jgi:hypothetical protein